MTKSATLLVLVVVSATAKPSPRLTEASARREHDGHLRRERRVIKEHDMSTVNLRALPGSLIATLPDGSEKFSFAGDWGSLKWKVHNWALDNKRTISKTNYEIVRDRLKELGAKPGTRPVKIVITDRSGDKITFLFTPEASPRKGGNKPSKKPASSPGKKTPKAPAKQPAKVSGRAARRTVATKAA